MYTNGKYSDEELIKIVRTREVVLSVYIYWDVFFSFKSREIRTLLHYYQIYEKILFFEKNL